MKGMQMNGLTKFLGLMAIVATTAVGASQPAFADQTDNIIDVTSDAFPGSTYHVAITTDFAQSNAGQPSICKLTRYAFSGW